MMSSSPVIWKRATRRQSLRRAHSEYIGRETARSGVDEVTVRDWVLDQFRVAGMVTDSGPIVAVNSHAGDPHYEPNPETSAPN